MPKVATRPISRYTQTALELLGQTIRAERIAGRMSAEQLAARAGISRSLLQRVEKGDPGCAIGVVFLPWHFKYSDTGRPIRSPACISECRIPEPQFDVIRRC